MKRVTIIPDCEMRSAEWIFFNPQSAFRIPQL
jgi:hypothetical protein